MPMPRRFTFLVIGRVAFALAWVPLVVSRAASQESPCDKGLEGLARGPLGYTWRGDRCEGMYTQQVAGADLWLASLTQSFEDYDLTSDRPLVVEWAAPDSGTVRLRAQGLKHDLYYRMDAARPAATHSYRWPSDLLAAQHISRDDIGVLGWTSRLVNGVQRQVFVPLRVTQRRAAAAGDYDVLLFPGVELQEVYVSLAALGPDGRAEKTIQSGKPLGYGPYQADTPLGIRLPKLPAPGIYRAEISAEIATGGPTSVVFWFYHAPPAP
jgi:hypothetical protein